MYSIIKRVIESGSYKLSNVLQKIASAWVDGELTDDQKQELRQLAQEYASVASEVDIMERLLDLEKRVRELETGQPTEAPPEEYPPFIDGKWYYAGDTCSEDGKNYTCSAPEGVVCVWSPSVYPAYWKEVTGNV